jgi:hypothetical protein
MKRGATKQSIEVNCIIAASFQKSNISVVRRAG